MRILLVCLGDPSTDPRIRKELQHLRSRGHRDIGVMALYAYRPENVVCWHDGFLDGCPLFRVNSLAASHVREAALALKPDVIHVHELDALWALLAVWDDDSVRAIGDGADAADSGVSMASLPVRLIYEAHEYERGRHGGSEERIKRASLCAGIANDVIVVSPAIAVEFEHVFGRKPHVVPNSFVRRTLPSSPGRAIQAAQPRPGQRVAAFCGNVTVGRGLDVLGEAMRLLGQGWKLVVLGDVKDQGVADDLARGNEVHFLGRAPYPYPHERESIVEWLSGVDVGINLVDLSIESYRMALPNKLFEYSFSGVRVVSNPQVDVVRLTNEYDLGWIANVSGRTEDLEVDAPRLAAVMEHAVHASPRTDDFIGAWCWEETGGKVLDQLYGTAG